MERIVHFENLREAFLRAVRGKAMKGEAQRFRANLDEELDKIRRALADGSYDFARYRFFTIYDPKQRLICAAPFAERVAFHAMMRICHPVFDNYQIYDSYASRKDKGVYKALERASCFSRRYKWFAKLDVCKYFDSIDHGVLMGQLAALFKDKLLLQHFRRLLDSYHTASGKGLPIGNLPSQYFANHYLATADHYAKEQLRLPGLIRYMDDILLFGNDKDALLCAVHAYREYVGRELRLDFHPVVLNRTESGIPFLGYVVYPYKLRLNGRSRRRFGHKMQQLQQQMNDGMMGEDVFAAHATALLAFVEKADVRAFRHSLSCRQGWVSMEQAPTA